MRRGPCSREVAASLGKKYQTVGQYLRAADGIDAGILQDAGVVIDGEPDHRRLAQLSLAGLLRVAGAAEQGREAGAQRLLTELKRAGDALAAAEILRHHEQQRRLRGTGANFQINIRQALSELTPVQAERYLDRMAPAVSILAARAAAGLAPQQAEALARTLEEAARHLRRPT